MSDDQMDHSLTLKRKTPDDPISDLEQQLVAMRDQTTMSHEERESTIMQFIRRRLPMSDAITEDTKQNLASAHVTVLDHGLGAIQSTSMVKSQTATIVQNLDVFEITQSSKLKKPHSYAVLRACITVERPLSGPASHPSPFPSAQVYYGNFVESLRAPGPSMMFQLCGSDNSPFNAVAIKMSSSILAQKSDVGKPKTAVKYRDEFFLSTLKNDSYRPLTLYSVQIFVTVIADTRAPEGVQNKLLVQGFGQTEIVKTFVIPLPDSGTQIEEKKQCLQAVFDSAKLRGLLENVFNTKDKDASTLINDCVPHLFYNQDICCRVAKKTSTDDWPEICVMLRLTPLAHVKAVTDMTLQPEKVQSALSSKDTQKCVILKELNLEQPVQLKKSIYMGTLNSALNVPFLTLSKFKSALESACYLEDDVTSSVVLLKSSFLKKTSFALKGLDGSTISNMRGAMTSFFGELLPEDVLVTVRESVREQVESLNTSGITVPGMAISIATCSMENSVNNRGKLIPGLKQSLFDLSTDNIEQFGILKEALHAILHQTLRSGSSSYDKAFDESELSNFNLSTISSFIMNNLSEDEAKITRLNFLAAAFYVTAFGVLVENQSTFANLYSYFTPRLPYSEELFTFQPNKATIIFGAQHWFLIFTGTLMYTVDILYGKDKRLSTSWLKYQMTSLRTIRCGDLHKTLIQISSFSFLFKKNQFASYADTITPRHMLKVLAMLGLAMQGKSVSDANAMSVDQAKEQAMFYIDTIVEYRKTMMPSLKVDEFAEDSDKFDIADFESIFSEGLPDTLEFSAKVLPADA